MSSRCRPARARRGQSLVELALIMPLLALLLLGTVDLSRVFFYYTRLSSAVLEGAFYGGHLPDKTVEIRNRAYKSVGGQLGTTGTDFVIDVTTDIRCYQQLTTTPIATVLPGTCTDKDANGNSIVAPGDSIEVTGHYVFRPLTSQVIRLLPANYRIRKSARMVIQ